MENTEKSCSSQQYARLSTAHVTLMWRKRRSWKESSGELESSFDNSNWLEQRCESSWFCCEASVLWRRSRANGEVMALAWWMAQRHSNICVQCQSMLSKSKDHPSIRVSRMLVHWEVCRRHSEVWVWVLKWTIVWKASWRDARWRCIHKDRSRHAASQATRQRDSRSWRLHTCWLVFGWRCKRLAAWIWWIHPIRHKLHSVCTKI